MSAITFELEADLRQVIGRGASRRLRKQDRLPAVVYGAGEAPVSLLLDHNKTLHALSHEAFYSHILTLKVNNKSEKVILKAIQRHPAKPKLLHIDFLRVRADQKLTMSIPIHFVGEEDAPGVKEGGAFSHLLSDVEVSCFPADLPEFIQLDVSHMELNQVLHLSDLTLPKGVEVVAAHGIESDVVPVITLHVPRAVEEEPVVAAEEGEAASEGSEEASEESDGGEENKE